MNDFPPGWVFTTMGAICDIVSGSTPRTADPANWDGAIPWITPDDLSGYTRKFIERGRRSLTEKGYLSCSTQLVPAGTVLYTSRAPIGYVAIAAQPVCTNQGFKNFVPPDGVLSHYVYWYLKHATPDVRSLGSGTTFLEISKKRAASIPIPIPPTAEQRRIVAAIEEQFSRIDAGVEALQRARRNLQRMRTAVLQAVVTGRLVPQDPDDEPAQLLLKRTIEARKKSSTPPLNLGALPHLPASWTWTSMGAVFDVFVGATPSRSKPELWNGSVSWVSSGEVAFNRIAATRETISRDALSDPVTRIHPPGTVMLAMIGEGKTRGQAAILDIPAAHNQNSAAIRVSQTEIIPEYVFFVLMQRYEETRRLAVGGNQPALNKARVEAIPLPLPPIGEQKRIVGETQRQFSLIDSTGATIGQASKQSSTLKHLVLREAFMGRLVAQDPGDEPAQILLDRIKSATVVHEHAGASAGAPADD